MTTSKKVVQIKQLYINYTLDKYLYYQVLY